MVRPQEVKEQKESGVIHRSLACANGWWFHWVRWGSPEVKQVEVERWWVAPYMLMWGGCWNDIWDEVRMPQDRATRWERGSKKKQFSAGYTDSGLIIKWMRTETRMRWDFPNTKNKMWAQPRRPLETKDLTHSEHLHF